MRVVVAAALAIPVLSAFVGCGGSSKHEGARDSGSQATSGTGGAGGSSGSAGNGTRGGLGGDAEPSAAGAPDFVECGSSQPCGVDFPCQSGGTCVSIQGCSGSHCGDPELLCTEACGSAGCVTIPAAGASPMILQCADGSHPRTADPIVGFGDSCNALPDELERLARCTSDADCGQVLEMFTPCASLPGPGRPPVVRKDGDLTELERLLTMFTLDGCPAVRRACSCPPPGDVKVACVNAHCAWDPAGACPPPDSQ